MNGQTNQVSGQTNQVSCPTSEEISHFLNASLESGDFRRIESHLEVCDTCCRLADELRHSLPVIEGGVLNILIEDERRFVMTKRLGSGSVGEVWRCDDKVLNRLVAAKLFHANDEDQAEREAELLISLADCGGVVSIYSVRRIEHDDELRWALIMEYAEDGNLSNVLNSIKSPSRESKRRVLDSLRMISKVASTLAFAHKKKISHLDIKPENILVSAGRPLLSDFGTARFKEQLHEYDGEGTAAYAAPEQFDVDGEVGPHSDSWAIGHLISQCFGVKQQRMDMNGGEKLKKLPPLPCHRKMFKLVEACLCVDPEKRPTAAKINRAINFAIWWYRFRFLFVCVSLVLSVPLVWFVFVYDPTIGPTNCDLLPPSPNKINSPELLGFDAPTTIEVESELARQFDLEFGLRNRLEERGGSNVLFNTGNPTNEFGKAVWKAKYSHPMNSKLENVESFVFRNLLGEEIANRWLQCLKSQNGGAALCFEGTRHPKLRISYENEDLEALEILKIRVSSGIEFRNELNRRFTGEQVVGIKRKPGTNNMEGVLIKCRASNGKEFTLEAYLPPKIPLIVHWTEEISVSVPHKNNRKEFKFTIPEIPDGVEAELVAVYQGGTPADRARVNLDAAAHVFEETSGQEVDFVHWRLGEPNTHIGVSKQSFKLKPGKYRIEGTSIVEQNDDWRGGSLLKLMVILKLPRRSYLLKW